MFATVVFIRLVACRCKRSTSENVDDLDNCIFILSIHSQNDTACTLCVYNTLCVCVEHSNSVPVWGYLQKVGAPKIYKLIQNVLTNYDICNVSGGGMKSRFETMCTLEL